MTLVSNCQRLLYDNPQSILVSSAVVQPMRFVAWIVGSIGNFPQIEEPACRAASRVLQIRSKANTCTAEEKSGFCTAVVLEWTCHLRVRVGGSYKANGQLQAASPQIKHAARKGCNANADVSFLR